MLGIWVLFKGASPLLMLWIHSFILLYNFIPVGIPFLSSIKYFFLHYIIPTKIQAFICQHNINNKKLPLLYLTNYSHHPISLIFPLQKNKKKTKNKQTQKPTNQRNKTLRLVLLVHLLFFIHFSLSISLYLWNYSCQRLMIAMLPNPLSLLSLILDFHVAFTIVDHSCSIVKHSPLDYYDITFLPHRLFLLILLLVHLPPLPNFEMLEIPLAQFSIYSLWLDNLI